MSYYERVKAFRDSQQVLVDNFLEEVVLTGLITKPIVTKENKDRIWFQFRSNQLNRHSLASMEDRIREHKNDLARTGNKFYNEMIEEIQLNIRFWDIARPLLKANNKLEQIKYFARQNNR